MPSSWTYVSFLPVASSAKTITTPGFKNESSLKRFARMSHLNPRYWKISWSGENVTVVPVSGVSPTTCRGSVTCPLAKRMRWIFPLRRTSTSIHSESAFTQDTPTPCRPPETL